MEPYCCAQNIQLPEQIPAPGMLACGLDAKGKMLEMTGTEKSLGLLVTHTGHMSTG